jgi:hypothetical protein
MVKRLQFDRNKMAKNWDTKLLQWRSIKTTTCQAMFKQALWYPRNKQRSLRSVKRNTILVCLLLVHLGVCSTASCLIKVQEIV